ncbi:MAG: hypothetical protein ICV83_25520 [Cytophagales bacterium]|nr:hypothetical protein [Cytophagales bacterium]
MTLLWLYSSFLNLDRVAEKLYGRRSRLHTYRLRRKLVGEQRFEPWEVVQLELLKREVLGHLGFPENTATGHAPDPMQ